MRLLYEGKYCNKSLFTVLIMFKRITLFFITFVCTFIGKAQDSAKIVSEEIIYNFGTIKEENGVASHIFKIKNEGKAPLVIKRVTASCGCTQPEWNKAPIAPGATTDVKISYDPTGRPGPFYKTISIFSNGKTGSFRLAIKGNVTPKPIIPELSYPYTIGEIGLTDKSIQYSTILPGESAGKSIGLKNNGKKDVLIHIGNTPHYLTVTLSSDTLKAGSTSELYCLLDAGKLKHKGHHFTKVPIYISDTNSRTSIEDQLAITSNYIDDFSKLTTNERKNAPKIALSGTLIDFGIINKSRGLFSKLKKKTTTKFEIANNGKTNLILHSISSDEKEIHLSSKGKIVKPSAKTTVKVSVKTKEIKEKFKGLITIVANDPDNPVQLIKVIAKKEN